MWKKTGQRASLESLNELMIRLRIRGGFSLGELRATWPLSSSSRRLDASPMTGDIADMQAKVNKVERALVPLTNQCPSVAGFPPYWPAA
jgi:hypothetical protein